MDLNIFKSQKLKITSYTRPERNSGGIPFEVMFNPNSISIRHENKFSNKKGVGTSGATKNYIYSFSDKVSLDLVIDGTGVADFGIATLIGKGTASVAEQVDKFLNLCFKMDGKIHEPKFLKIQWGTGVLKNFDCVLQSVDIEYTLFDKNGASLHAILKTTFIRDVAPGKLPFLEGKNSPDLSHTRVVRSGDTLPLLSKEIYGSSQYYLRLAQVNNLDDFRNLTPGQELIFPPLENQGNR